MFSKPLRPLAKTRAVAAARPAVIAAVLRVETNRIAALEFFDAAGNRSDHTGSADAENPRQTDSIPVAPLAHSDVEKIDRSGFQANDDIVGCNYLRLDRLFVTQLFDAAMMVNPYRFQEFSQTSIKFASKNENQSQREMII